MRRQTDEQVLRAARRGSRVAVSELYRRYAGLVWRTADAIVGDRSLAEDVMQDSFLKVIRGLVGFDPDRPFGPWLRRITANTALSALRARGREVFGLEWLSDRPVEPPRPRDQGLARAVRQLSPERRAVVVLRYWLDLPPTEIAELLGVPTGTVHSRLARGLDDLRHALRQEETHAGRP